MRYAWLAVRIHIYFNPATLSHRLWDGARVFHTTIRDTSLPPGWATARIMAAIDGTQRAVRVVPSRQNPHLDDLRTVVHSLPEWKHILHLTRGELREENGGDHTSLFQCCHCLHRPVIETEPVQVRLLVVTVQKRGWGQFWGWQWGCFDVKHVGPLLLSLVRHSSVGTTSSWSVSSGVQGTTCSARISSVV